MGEVTFSSREFNQDVPRALEIATQQPVVILEGDEPAHVLISIEEYERLSEMRATFQKWALKERPAQL